MTIVNEVKLMALKCALEKTTNTLASSWEFSKENSRKKAESEGKSKTELELLLDAYAAFSFACGMTTLELLEREKLIVVSPSQRSDAACKLAITPIAFIGTKAAIDEILAIARENDTEAKVEES
jgi:hypothetical protein